MEREIRDRVEALRQQLADGERALEELSSRREGMSANRQVHHEAEERFGALVASRKQLEDCRDHAQRMDMIMEGLKRCTGRFLTKVTRQAHPAPTSDNLADMMHKLAEEVARVVKQVAATMVKDGASAAAFEAHEGEAPRLDKLPGYRDVTQVLFDKLMNSKIDGSARNLRVVPPVPPIGMSSSRSTEGLHDDAAKGEELRDPTLDRLMIKKLSKLVASKDGAKAVKKRTV